MLGSIVAASLVIIQVGSSKINLYHSILQATQVKSSYLLCSSVQTSQRYYQSYNLNFTLTRQPYYNYSPLLFKLLSLVVVITLLVYPIEQSLSCFLLCYYSKRKQILFLQKPQQPVYTQKNLIKLSLPIILLPSTFLAFIIQRPTIYSLALQRYTLLYTAITYQSFL